MSLSKFDLVRRDEERRLGSVTGGFYFDELHRTVHSKGLYVVTGAVSLDSGDMPDLFRQIVAAICSQPLLFMLYDDQLAGKSKGTIVGVLL